MKINFSKDIPYNDLPPLPPKAELETPDVLKLLTQASRNLGELNGLCEMLPDPRLLINTLALQESKDSSAIENIVTTQDELYKETAGEETGNISAKEVLRYREALYYGLDKMNKKKGIININLLIEIVQRITNNTSGIRNAPGTALRNAANNKIIYTPPCCEDVISHKLEQLEKFINNYDNNGLDPLIKLALIHYQFEAIHPFYDGNGRSGRILNALYLVQQKLLPQPVLYLSSYIIENKQDYYRLLREVTEKGNWQEWLQFNLTAISLTAKISSNKIRKITTLQAELETEMKSALGASYNHDLLRLIFAMPYVKIELLERNGIAHRQTASSYLKKLADAHILQPKKMGKTTYYINHRLMSAIVD